MIPLEAPVPLPLGAGAAEDAAAFALGGVLEADTDSGVLTYVEAVADRAPALPAVVDGATVLTYHDLLVRVGQIRDALWAAGCRGPAVVAAAGCRNADSVALFLALESTGSVYVPLARDWPSARARDVLELSGARAVVHYCDDEDEPCAPARAAARAGLALITLPAPGAACSGPPAEPVRSRATEARYCLFTSGTTGRPKGVVVEHRGMMNHLWATARVLGLAEGDRVAFTAPLGFVVSVWQMLAPLLVGATVAVVRDDRMVSPRRLVSALEAVGAHVVELVPTVVAWLADRAERGPEPCLPQLRWLVSTGEVLPSQLAARVRSSLGHVRLLNAYGSTECSDDVTHYEVTRAGGRERLPVGTAVPNVRLYLLEHDERARVWRAVRPGQVGELFVGGLAVCQGYAKGSRSGEPAVFVDAIDPASPTGRLYRTGDLARVADGVVHYAGRADRQVKIAGVRMELDEIEATLRAHPVVAQAAVITVTAGERRRLAAFFVARDALSAGELTAWLAGLLPAAMVPDHLVAVEALPLSANGKTDYRELGRRLATARKGRSQ